MRLNLDIVSPLVDRLLDLEADRAFTRLVVEGPGNQEAGTLLEGAGASDLINGAIQRREDAQAMLAGLWLWHDWLDKSHAISQGIDSPTGSFWHAMMHRREGDFSNSRFWYAKCRNHPAMSQLSEQARPLLSTLPAEESLLELISGGWDPGALVDLIREVHKNPDDPRHSAAVQLQQLEWRVLFEHCARQASGQ